MNGFKNLDRQVLEKVEKVLNEKFGRSINVKSTQRLGGGCINHALKIETSVGNFFMKWNDRGNADIFEKEAEGLVALRKSAGEMLKIPEVVGFDQIDETPGFIMLEYLEPSGGNSKSDEKLGRGLALMHRNSATGFGFYANNYCGATLQNNEWKTSWTEFYRDNRLGFLIGRIQNIRQFLPEERRLFEKLLEKLPDLLPLHSAPSLIHGDLWSGNYMYSTQGTALIDPAVSFSDREMEFGMITLFGGFSKRFFDSYNEENPLPLDWKQRNQLYQLYHLLNHYLLFGETYLYQAKLIVRGYL